MNVETELKRLFDDITNMSDKLGFSTEAPRIPAFSIFRDDAARTQVADAYILPG